jgi:hypothetical protein
LWITVPNPQYPGLYNYTLYLKIVRSAMLVELQGEGLGSYGPILDVDGQTFDATYFHTHDYVARFYWAVGSVHSYSWYNIVANASTATGKRYSLTGTQNGTVTVGIHGNSVAVNYKTQYLVNVFSAGGTPPPGTEQWADVGTNVTLTPDAREGYRFDHWLLDGADAGANATLTFPADTSHNATAVYLPLGTVTFCETGLAEGNGTVLTVDDTPYTIANLPSFSW